MARAGWIVCIDKIPLDRPAHSKKFVAAGSIWRHEKTDVHNTRHNLQPILHRSSSAVEKRHALYHKAPSFDVTDDSPFEVWQITAFPDTESGCETLSIPNGFAQSSSRSFERHPWNHDRIRTQNCRSLEFHFDAAYLRVWHTPPISEFVSAHQKDFGLAMIRTG